MPHRGFLSLKSFVNWSAGRPFHFPASLLLVLALPPPSGCGGEPPATRRAVEDSQTSGRIELVVVPGASLPGGIREGPFPEAVSRGTDPRAYRDVARSGHRPAVDSGRTSRSSPGSWSRRRGRFRSKGAWRSRGSGSRATASARLSIRRTCSSPSPRLEDLKRIYANEVHDWNELNVGKGRIEPIVGDPGSDLTTAFGQRVLGGMTPTAPAFRAESDSAVLERARRSPGAIGFVSMASS